MSKKMGHHQKTNHLMIHILVGMIGTKTLKVSYTKQNKMLIKFLFLQRQQLICAEVELARKSRLKEIQEGAKSMMKEEKYQI